MDRGCVTAMTTTEPTTTPMPRRRWLQFSLRTLMLLVLMLLMVLRVLLVLLFVLLLIRKLTSSR